MKRAFAVTAAILMLTGCDALVGGECADGFAPADGECAPITNEAVSDGGSAGGGIGGAGGGPMNLGGTQELPPADICHGNEVLCFSGCADLMTSATNCGSCGYVCPSGICIDGVCEGDVAGHVVAMGMNYTSSTPASRKVLGNAVFLSVSNPVRILEHGLFASEDSVTAIAGILHEQAAIRNRLISVSTAHGDDGISGLEPAYYDVVLIHDQVGAPASWGSTFAALTHDALSAFLSVGGTVIVLGTENSPEMPDVMNGIAQLGVDAIVPLTGSRIISSDPTDVISIGVPTPYAARHITSAFQTTTISSETFSFVFVDEADPTLPIVIHKGVSSN